MKVTELVDYLLAIKSELGKDPLAGEIDRVLRVIADMDEKPENKITVARNALNKISSKSNLPLQFRWGSGQTIGDLYNALDTNKTAGKELLSDLKTEHPKEIQEKIRLNIDINYLDPIKLEEFFRKIQKAQNENNDDELIFLLSALKRYFDDKVKQYPSKSLTDTKANLTLAYRNIIVSLKSDIDQMKMGALFTNSLTNHNLNPFLTRFTINSAGYEKIKPKILNSDETIARYMTHNMPIAEVLPRLREIILKDRENVFKVFLQDYQITHAFEIRDAQVVLAEKSLEGQTPQASLNKINLQQQPTLQKTPEDYRQEERAKLQAKASYDFLLHVERTILTTKWKTGLSGKKVYDDEIEKKYNTVTPNQKAMLQIIKEAKQAYQSNDIKTVNEKFVAVIEAGKKAALKKPRSFLGFGKRDEGVQTFFNLFKTADENKGKMHKSEQAVVNNNLGKKKL